MAARKSPAGKADRTPPSARSPWPAFLTAHATIVTAMEQRIKAAGLPELSWYDVLWALERSPEQRLRMHELAHALVMSRSNITRLVDRLVAAGLVARDRDCPDRRGQFAVLTEAGRRMRVRMWPAYAAAIEELFDRHLSAAESAAMRTILRRLLAAARKQNAP